MLKVLKSGKKAKSKKIDKNPKNDCIFRRHEYNNKLSGGLAEWSKAVDLKSIVGQLTAGSNPAPSASFITLSPISFPVPHE